MATPAMPGGEEFCLEAAIVNYFGAHKLNKPNYLVKNVCALLMPGDTLGGHLDDMEADWTKPIVSISLGCKVVFLLGGKSRQDPSVAMFLRSGDIVLMVVIVELIFLRFFLRIRQWQCSFEVGLAPKLPDR
ncbi:hypothetical protein CsSME_00019420 [Camellia sinensis var. sinensis]